MLAGGDKTNGIPMRLTAFAPVGAAIVLLTLAPVARAQVVVLNDGSQTYAGVGDPADERDRDNDSGRRVINAVATGPSPRTIYEHAFYTPVPNFQQAGYQCAGIVSVSFKGRTRQLHRGTYCLR